MHLSDGFSSWIPNLKFLSKVAAAVVILGEGVYLAVKIIKLQKQYSNAKEDSASALFFPDPEIACYKHFTSQMGCMIHSCKFSHDPSLSYSKILTAINTCKKSLDVCVFCFTSNDICKVLKSCNERGVRVRVITDSDQSTSTGSVIQDLRKSGTNYRGIPVRK